MAFNNYGNYGYGMYPQYNANLGYQNFQQPMGQQMQPQMMQQQTQSNDIPFSEMHFGNLKEAEAYIVAPMKSVCFVNNALEEIYVKSADNMGNPSFKTYKLQGSTNNSKENKTAEFDPNLYVKKADLGNFATLKDLDGLLTTKDLQEINTKIDRMQRQIKIKEIEREGFENGKQSK